MTPACSQIPVMSLHAWCPWTILSHSRAPSFCSLQEMIPVITNTQYLKSTFTLFFAFFLKQTRSFMWHSSMVLTFKNMSLPQMEKQRLYWIDAIIKYKIQMHKNIIDDLSLRILKHEIHPSNLFRSHSCTNYLMRWLVLLGWKERPGWIL